MLCSEEELDDIECSGKLMLLLSILADCNARGDKLLVFSQSLLTLNLIEKFLALITQNTAKPDSNARHGGFTGQWQKISIIFDWMARQILKHVLNIAKNAIMSQIREQGLHEVYHTLIC